MANISLMAPWEEFYHQIRVLFEKDSEVHVIYDSEEKKVHIYVDNACKAAALNRLLITEKEFGGTIVKVIVHPSNESVVSDFMSFKSEKYKMSNASWFDVAFEGNPIYAFSIGIDVPLAPNFTFVVFAREILQYYSDNLWDYHGATSILAQDIAREVFNADMGVSFSTALEGEVKPTKSWP